MAAKPSDVPQWATDANYTTGPVPGTPTKVTPNAAIRAEGDVPATPSFAQRWNWWKNLVGQWLDFINPWFGPGATPEIVYPDVRFRTVGIPGLKLNPAPAAATAVWRCDGTVYSYSLINSSFASLDLSEALPSGATLDNVQIRCSTGAVSVDGMRFRVYKYNWTTQALTQLGATVTSGAAINANDLAVIPLINEVIDKATYAYYLEVRSSSNAAGSANGDRIHAAIVGFYDSGPRNF